MLFAGKIKMICLLVGLLTIGEVGIQAAGTQNAPVVVEASQSTEENVDAYETEEKMSEIYEKLQEEEAQLRAQLQKEEEVLTAHDEEGQLRVRDLNEELRRVQLQERVLKARLEESFDK